MKKLLTLNKNSYQLNVEKTPIRGLFYALEINLLFNKETLGSKKLEIKNKPRRVYFLANFYADAW